MLIYRALFLLVSLTITLIHPVRAQISSEQFNLPTSGTENSIQKAEMTHHELEKIKKGLKEVKETIATLKRIEHGVIPILAGATICSIEFGTALFVQSICLDIVSPPDFTAEFSSDTILENFIVKIVSNGLYKAYAGVKVGFFGGLVLFLSLKGIDRALEYLIEAKKSPISKLLPHN